MRKSIKKIAATFLAATMTMGLAVSAFGAAIDPTAIPAGETIYTLTGNMTDPSWSPADDANVMQATEFDGVVSFDITVPAWDEANSWMSRFSICAFNSDTIQAAWNRILLGAPDLNIGDLGVGMLGDVTNLTQVRIAPEAETAVTVYFDTETYGLVVRDADGNDVEYLIGWCTSDDQETYYTPEQFAEMTFADYVETINPDRKANLEALGVSEIPDFVALRDALAAKLDGTEEEETTEEETTEEETEPEETDETCAAYSVVGSPELGIEWTPDAESCFVKDNEDGTYSKKLVATADGDFEFKILEDGVAFSWANQLELGTGSFHDNASQFKLTGVVAGDEFVVTFDPETGDVVVTKDGEDVEYLVRWDTREEADADFLTKEEALAKFVDAEEETSEEETEETTEAEETTAETNAEETTTVAEETTAAAETTTAAAETTTAAAAETTTAKNASTKTGDAAPIAVLVSLLGAVAVVALVAKKREA